MAFLSLNVMMTFAFIFFLHDPCSAKCVASSTAWLLSRGLWAGTMGILVWVLIVKSNMSGVDGGLSLTVAGVVFIVDNVSGRVMAVIITQCKVHDYQDGYLDGSRIYSPTSFWPRKLRPMTRSHVEILGVNLT